MRRIYFSFPLVLVTPLLNAADLAPTSKTAPKAPATAKVPSFQETIKPLLEAKCTRCHSEKTHKAELDLSSPSGLAKGGESGEVIVAGQPDQSPLLEKIQNGEMPPGKKDRLADAEINTIRLWIAAGASTGASVAKTEPPAALSEHDALPIMLRHCVFCHGKRQQKADLNLSSRAGILKGGKSGPAIIPGKPDQSLLINRIEHGQMPPARMLVEAGAKPVDASELETLKKWIAAGAPAATFGPDIATTEPDPLVSDKDRDFWAFIPPRQVAPPAFSHDDKVRNPIDAFILKKLSASGVAPAPEASRLTLLRRATFDLTGLAPSPEDVRTFLADLRPDAYERLIDRLLASPRYGERWARHWLDVAGYADSEGKREPDMARPDAWRFRDYVIKSLNQDKPYTRFLLEQLAGDELADYEHAPELTEELVDNLIATGFLRMVPDPTWADITGYAIDRFDVMADEIDVLGSAVLGLTMKCARCHSHKFDPIPHRDYYRLLDIFKGSYDEYDWLRPRVDQELGTVDMKEKRGRLLPYVTATERREWEANEARIATESKSIQQKLDERANTLAARYRDERLAKFTEAARSDVKAMLDTPADKRTLRQKQLADTYEKSLRIDRDELKKLDSGFKAECDQADERLKKLNEQRTKQPMIRALWDRGDPSPTYIYRRGDLNTPTRLVGPGVPSVLTDGKTPFDVKPPWLGAKKTGRRLAFANWLTRADHPLTARVAVNRIWKHHFGSGIVKTLGNFGKAGAPPTHPELLDWLACEFMNQGWSLKKLHRLIMTSATYRQSSEVTDEQLRLDPDNALVSRMPMARLDAEALYDTLLQVAGRLVEQPKGPPDDIDSRDDGLVTPVGRPEGWRRMIYVRKNRKKVPTHLENFDYPQMNPNCVERRDSIVALQALQLENMGMVHDLANHFARRVDREAGADPGRQVERAYLIAMAREPSAEEHRIGIETLRTLTKHWAQTSSSSAQADSTDHAQKALATYCHAIMNSAAFLYID